MHSNISICTVKNNNTIQQAADIIKTGGLVAFPTETVYGLGADAFNAKAVAKIFEIKGRPSFDPLIVHISNRDDLDLLFEEHDDSVRLLADKFWPGPLTIVKEKNKSVPDIVTSGLSTVAVRMPAHPIAIELIRRAKTPVAAPSANKFGLLSPTQAGHVRKQFPEIECIIDGGQTTVGIESTVIALYNDGFKLLRPGVISVQDLELVIPKSKSCGKESHLKSPGLLKSHYSPSKPLFIIGESDTKSNTQNAGLLSFSAPKITINYKLIEVLSEKGDLNEAAVNLFGALHRLEDSNVDFIVAEPIPETGIGIAIMDRLRKAAYQYKTNIKK